MLCTLRPYSSCVLGALSSSDPMPLEYGRVVLANTVGTRVGPAARLTEIDYHPTWTPRAQGEADPARGCSPVCRLDERAS